MQHRGQRLAQKCSAFVGADKYRNHRQIFGLLFTRHKAVKRTIAAKFIAPTRKARFKVGRAFMARPEVTVIARKSKDGFGNAQPAPWKAVGQHHLCKRH